MVVLQYAQHFERRHVQIVQFSLTYSVTQIRVCAGYLCGTQEFDFWTG